MNNNVQNQMLPWQQMKYRKNHTKNIKAVQLRLKTNFETVRNPIRNKSVIR